MYDVKIETGKNGTKIIIDGHDFKYVLKYEISSELVENGVESEINIKLPVKNLEIISI
ncbi:MULTISPECIES: hypothetical protein [unclassified Clostridioides]|uniref:hypothetical protein n=1 Tax=unclassified Clostridioides TaxID=2635829 RepID=UPI001D1097E0|nr:hypothetical protein [Clostridioides sp. ES-W-0018-02]MCC0705131.1 hypothetical protein [Clostridioides sp. ES-S-0049-02]MCC0713032.1 hypothetical protein [Clostridioides sp. ES-W-0017-02]